MSSVLEYQEAVREALSQTASSIEAAAARASVSDFEDALNRLGDAEHHIDMSRRLLRLAREAQVREAVPPRSA